jgi:hypothetical protein
MQRRTLLSCLGGSAALALLPRTAEATLVIGLTLPQLVERSAHILVVSALDSVSSYAMLGGRRCIVTDTRVRVEDVLAKASPAQQLLTVKTLGGRVAGMGELVLGQAIFSSASSDVAFLKRGADGAHWFVGMAQGHYPLLAAADSEPTLRHSANLPEIRDFQRSAVRELSGMRLSLARRLLQRASSR